MPARGLSIEHRIVRALGLVNNKETIVLLLEQTTFKLLLVPTTTTIIITTRKIFSESRGNQFRIDPLSLSLEREIYGSTPNTLMLIMSRSKTKSEPYKADNKHNPSGIG